MNGVIEHVTRALGPTPRKFGWWDRFTYLYVIRPRWADNDPLRRWFAGFPALLKHGRITWGRTVQVNALLFTPGDLDHPGEVIYADAGETYSSPERLEPIATALYALKGTTPADPAEARIAAYLTDERERVFGWTVPRSIAGGMACRISTVFFDRSHLPNKLLSLPFFPVLVAPDDSGLAAVVPSRFWPADFTRWWLDQENPDPDATAARNAPGTL